jgi:hypothetical protein
LPSMAPKPSTGTIIPIVLPIPFCIDSTALETGIPEAMATDKETIMKEMNGFILNASISSRKKPIPRMTTSRGMAYGFMFISAYSNISM